MSSSIHVPMNNAGRPILASLYDLTEFDSDEEKLFSRNAIPVALLGGFAMRLAGQNRETRDVDVVFQAPHKFAQMWGIIDQERRLIIPKQRTVSDVVKIFVRTGGEWDKCGKKMPVEVDLVQAGSNNSPHDVLANRKAISIGADRTLYICNLFYLLKGKFDAYHTRGYQRDRDDIAFLVRGNESEIASFRESLDPQKVRKFVKSYSGNLGARYALLFGIQL